MKRLEMISSLFAYAFIFAASPFTTMGCSVFILAGQSNMAGRGGVTYVNKTSHWDGRVPPECQPNPQLLRLNDELLWEEAEEPLHRGIISMSNCTQIHQTSGIGPGMPFSNSLLKRDPLFGVIGLVPCAVGGTTIAEWSRGSCLYNRLLKRARAAVVEGGVLRGMLWYQGESDANPDDAKMYETRLEAFFTDLRNDLRHPWLPIVQVALASGGNLSEREIVREAQLKTSLSNVKCVDAAGLPLIKGDGVHLTTDSQLRLGSMMADAFLRYF